MDWAKTTAGRDDKHLSLGTCVTYIKGLMLYKIPNKHQLPYIARFSPDFIHLANLLMTAPQWSA